jgi:gas vesicle protein
MLTGAIIGGVVGLIMYLIQNNQKKKKDQSDIIDHNTED